VFHLRDNPGADLVFLAAAGMAPHPGVAALDGRPRHRPQGHVSTTARRRRRDLCFEDELRKIEETLPNFRYVPALSEPDGSRRSRRLGRRGRPDHRWWLRRNEETLAGADAYVCGPRRW